MRRAGIEALGARADPESRALLEDFVADPDGDPYLRGLAAMRAPGPPAAAAIGEALASARQPWRVVPLAFAAVHLGDQGAHDSLRSASPRASFP